MNCEYFDKSVKKGNCIFSFNCMDDCLFKYKKEAELIPKLRSEIEGYKYELANLDYKKDSLQELVNEQEDLIHQFESLLDFTKDLLRHTTKTKDELTTNIKTMTIPGEYESQLQSVVEETCNA